MDRKLLKKIILIEWIKNLDKWMYVGVKMRANNNRSHQLSAHADSDVVSKN
jgi:hypothetical protein